MVAPKKKIAAAELKAKCLQIIDEVSKSGQSVIVTKHGKPMVRIVPIERRRPDDVFGCLAHKMQLVGDVEVSPFPAHLWEGLK